jgi:hypothetical protein
MASEQFYKLCLEKSDDEVHRFVEKHLDTCSNWNLGLTAACKTGNKDIQHMMIIYGAKYCGNCDKTIIAHIQQ